LSLLAKWCTRLNPDDRPSMRMIAVIMTLAHETGDFSAMLDLFMSYRFDASPDSPADWALLQVVLRKQPAPITSIQWFDRNLSVAAVRTVAAELRVRDHGSFA
jgi:hypothetical protein